jgi:hypothetical protein
MRILKGGLGVGHLVLQSNVAVLMADVWSVGGMVAGRRKLLKCLKKGLSEYYFCATNRTGMRLNLDVHSENPVTNCYSYGTSPYKKLTVMWHFIFLVQFQSLNVGKLRL